MQRRKLLTLILDRQPYVGLYRYLQVGEASVARHCQKALHITVNSNVMTGLFNRSDNFQICVKHFCIAELFKELLADTPVELSLSGCQSIYGNYISILHSR